MKPVKWNCGAKAGCGMHSGFHTKPCQENNHPKLLLFPASLPKCGSVTGRYVSQSHPGLNSIKESTKTYGSGRVIWLESCAQRRRSFDSYPLLSGRSQWRVFKLKQLSQGGLPWVGCSILKGLFEASRTNLSQSTGHIVIISSVRTDCSHKTSTKTKICWVFFS